MKRPVSVRIRKTKIYGPATARHIYLNFLPKTSSNITPKLLTPVLHLMKITYNRSKPDKNSSKQFVSFYCFFTTASYVLFEEKFISI